jgi:hypothetical protein
MGSASSPTLRSCEPTPTPNASLSWMIGVFASLAAAVMITTRPRLGLAAVSVWVLVLFCLLWKKGLDSAGTARAWTLLLSVLLAWELIVPVLQTRQPAISVWPSALGCYLLAYLMIWTLSAQNSDLELQALATAALLLSTIVFARPAVLASAFFLSVVLLLLCRKIYGGVIESALLIFTPVVLCILTLLLLHKFAPEIVDEPLSQLGKLWLPHVSRPQFTPALTKDILSALGFVFAALCYRMFEQRVGIADLACSGLLLFMVMRVALGSTESTAIDIRMTAYGGGMCLVSNAPPRKRFSLLLLILPLCSAAVRELK